MSDSAEDTAPEKKTRRKYRVKSPWGKLDYNYGLKTQRSLFEVFKKICYTRRQSVNSVLNDYMTAQAESPDGLAALMDYEKKYSSRSLHQPHYKGRNK